VSDWRARLGQMLAEVDPAAIVSELFRLEPEAFVPLVFWRDRDGHWHLNGTGLVLEGGEDGATQVP
jgi:hypothetical protein